MMTQSAEPLYYTYDLETMRTVFLFCGKFDGQPETQVFEISERRNDRNALLNWLSYLQNSRAIMVGYNNLAFDYNLIHDLLTNPYVFDAQHAYLLGQKIIQERDFARPAQSIRMSDRIIPQIDLMKVHHFDNVNKTTSLKALQFAMRLESVEDLPYSPHQDLVPGAIDELISYGIHDVIATEQFLHKSKPALKMRQELIEHGIISGDVLNYSDVKIGTEYLIKKIGRARCFISGSNPKQTLRAHTIFKDIILPKIHFRTEAFNAVLEWFKSQVYYTGRDERPALKVNLGSLEFSFGMGGVHASVDNQVFETTDTHIIKDVDVGSMYPAIALANDFAPEHLGQDFSRAYRQLSEDRKQHAKGTFMNLVLKLANNGATGNFENKFSCFYDIKCAHSIRINGQLQALQLAEMLWLIPGVKLIQANTDGVTALVPREMEGLFDLWCNDWEAQTGLKLEHVPYKRMWIRDVNNYLAETMDGKIKRKGAYWYPITEDDYHGGSGSNWNKNFSMMAVQKCVEEVMLHGHKPEDIVRLIVDPFDFMIRYKTVGAAKVYIGDREQQRTLRYYVSTAGERAKKVAPPKGIIGHYKRKNKLTDEFYNKVMAEIPAGTWDERIHTGNKSKYAAVTTSIESGWLVKECNKASDFNWNDLNYDYYVAEIKKLIIGESHETKSV